MPQATGGHSAGSAFRRESGLMSTFETRTATMVHHVTQVVFRKHVAMSAHCPSAAGFRRKGRPRAMDSPRETRANRIGNAEYFRIYGPPLP
jgi:hypothetical protein